MVVPALYINWEPPKPFHQHENRGKKNTNNDKKHPQLVERNSTHTHTHTQSRYTSMFRVSTEMMGHGERMTRKFVKGDTDSRLAWLHTLSKVNSLHTQTPDCARRSGVIWWKQATSQL